MYCALGDLTQEEDFYLKSWEISGKKYARAKRSLASALFRKDKVAEAAVAMRVRFFVCVSCVVFGSMHAIYIVICILVFVW